MKQTYAKGYVYPLKLREESLKGLTKITEKLGCSKADAIRDAIKHYAEYLEGLEVVNLRNVSVDEAKQEIREYLKGKDRVSADEISDELRIDFSLVNRILLLLWEEGVVEPSE